MSKTIILGAASLLLTAACSAPALEDEDCTLVYPNACTATVSEASLAPVVRSAPRPVGGEVEEVVTLRDSDGIELLGMTDGYKVVRKQSDGPVGYLPNENIRCFGRPAPADRPGFPFEEERLPLECEVRQAAVLPFLHTLPWPESFRVEPLDPGQPITVLGATEPAPPEFRHSYFNGHYVVARTHDDAGYVRWHDVACELAT